MGYNLGGRQEQWPKPWSLLGAQTLGEGPGHVGERPTVPSPSCWRTRLFLCPSDAFTKETWVQGRVLTCWGGADSPVHTHLLPYMRDPSTAVLRER